MSDNLVNLNVNPCKMCMPMGAVTALYGIRGCMSILHGSQGCATYMRRHLATHFNEPIDIASSALTEQGTVFGGEANLLKGLSNLIELYHPEVIGVCTTCLAETIGEDTRAIINKFYEQNPGLAVKIIDVSSPGYGGTQNEGFFAAVRAVIEQVEPVELGQGHKGDGSFCVLEDAENSKIIENTKRTVPLVSSVSPDKGWINIITPMISPADTRWLKGFLRELGLDFILMPDLSDNLDGVTVKTYQRLKIGGTPLSEVARMAGAQLTVEFSEYTKPGESPAVFLNQAHGVPYVQLPLPMGIRGMDAFIEALQEQGGLVSDELLRARGRYLDAMVDGHKYCARARAAVFGEPDFVTATVRLCCENGIVPVIAATGSVCADLKPSIEAEIAACADISFAEKAEIRDDCDFDTIEKYCQELGANLMIGSSEGRRIARRLGIPLIRCAFPIHDHVGGQRVRTLGFDGSLNILDQVANAMLDKTSASFRTELYQKFYKDEVGAAS
ncbi:MAG: hypothetical protein LBS98_06970 [Coriobacteriales bacterium]|jgi:nitrogenase molybdenum-iron protein alpha/beta subunit|nr:hypothetical protein [Coriobacteriales bacterium]